jgi:hypothetical protein
LERNGLLIRDGRYISVPFIGISSLKVAEKSLDYIKLFPVTTAWRVFRLGIEERSSRYGG